jgi:membrane-associated phospholipid phosphatase
MAVAGKAERAESADDPSFTDGAEERPASIGADLPTVGPGDLPADYVVMAFAVFNLVCIAVGFPHVRHGGWLLAGILSYLILVISLRWLPSARLQPLAFFRDAHPLLAIAPAYAIAGMINQSIFHRYFDDLVLGWDRAIFGGHPHQYLARMWPSGPLSEVLHLSYWLYLGLVPALGFTLYFMRRHAAFRIVATTASATFFLCQFAFVLFPVRGPYYTFPPVQAAGSVFPALVHATLDHGASVGTAFPSSHCAAAVVVAMLAWRYAPRVLAAGITLITLGILVGTVYGGFHYAVDAIAGLLIGLTMGVVGPRLHARLARGASMGQGA